MHAPIMMVALACYLCHLCHPCHLTSCCHGYSTELERPASQLFLHNLTGVLEAARRVTNWDPEDAAALERLDVKLMEVRRRGSDSDHGLVWLGGRLAEHRSARHRLGIAAGTCLAWPTMSAGPCPPSSLPRT